MLASGEAPEWIARQMGHTTTEMLFRVYSRFIPNLTRQDGSAFERLMAAQMQDQPHPIISPHSYINSNNIGVNHLPKTQSRLIEKNELGSILLETPMSASFTPLNLLHALPNTRVNPSDDAGLIANPWLAIAKHSSLSVPASNELNPPFNRPSGNLP
jgi:integrase